MSKNNYYQAFWLAVSAASAMLVSIVSAAILSRYFNKAEYGTYKQILFIYNTLLVIFEAGLPSVFSYFLPKYSHEEGKFIVKRINTVLFLLGFLLSATIFFASDMIAEFMGNPILAKGLKIFSPFPIFTLPTVGLEGIYIVNKNTLFIAIYNTITRLIMLLCIVLPVVFIRNSYEMAVIGWGIASVCAFVIAMIFIPRPYRDVTEEKKISGLYKNVMKYSLPIMGSSCILLFYNSINQILISRYFGVEAFAVFSNGFMPLPFIAIIVNPIRKMLVPMFSQGQAANDYSQAKSFMNKSIYHMCVIIIPLIVFCFAFAKQIMIFLYGAQYEISYIYFMVSLVFNAFEIFPIQVIVSGMGKTRELMIFDVIYTVILLAVNILFIKLGLSSPLFIAISFVIIQISLRYITPYLFLLFKQKFSSIEISIFPKMLKIYIHCIIIAIIVCILMRYIKNVSEFGILCIGLSLYYIILVGTSKSLHIDYVSQLLRIAKK